MELSDQGEMRGHGENVEGQPEHDDFIDGIVSTRLDIYTIMDGEFTKTVESIRALERE